MSKPVPKPKPSIKKKPSNIKVFTANWAYSAQVFLFLFENMAVKDHNHLGR